MRSTVWRPDAQRTSKRSDDLELDPASQALLGAVLLGGQPGQLDREASGQQQGESRLSEDHDHLVVFGKETDAHLTLLDCFDLPVIDPHQGVPSLYPSLAIKSISSTDEKLNLGCRTEHGHLTHTQLNTATRTFSAQNTKE